jgi:integrase
MTVAQLLERHHERHVKPAAKADFARHSRRLLEHFGDAVIADLTPAAVDGFTADMKATGRSGSYVDRILDSLRSALSKAHKLGEITSAPAIATVQRERYERRISAKEEFAAFWSAANEPHLHLFYQILLNTGARPNAILALTRFQVDIERRLINLQPPGRDETKKRNPVLPITDALMPYLRAATGDFLVAWHGKPLDSIKTAWPRTCARAGLPPRLEDSLEPMHEMIGRPQNRPRRRTIWPSEPRPPPRTGRAKEKPAPILGAGSI